MLTVLTPRQQLIADKLWEVGAVKIDIVNGFRIKAQDDDPTIPNSPFYMNIRTEDHPKNPGPVTQEIMDLIGDEIEVILDEEGWPFTAYADIPHAGTPFGDQVRRLLIKHGLDPSGRITMQKEDLPGGKRRITAEISCDRELTENELTALFDDLVTLKNTKLEAIGGLQANKLRVSLLVLFLDRGQGGVEGLEKLGYKVRAIMRVPDMLDYYYDKGLLSDEEYRVLRDYIGY